LLAADNEFIRNTCTYFQEMVPCARACLISRISDSTDEFSWMTKQNREPVFVDKHGAEPIYDARRYVAFAKTLHIAIQLNKYFYYRAYNFGPLFESDFAINHSAIFGSLFSADNIPVFSDQTGMHFDPSTGVV